VGGCGVGGDGPGAAVDEEDGSVFGRGCHGDYSRALRGVGEMRVGLRRTSLLHQPPVESESARDVQGQCVKEVVRLNN
jgi:hypothetical protein